MHDTLVRIIYGEQALIRPKKIVRVASLNGVTWPLLEELPGAREQTGFAVRLALVLK